MTDLEIIIKAARDQARYYRQVGGATECLIADAFGAFATSVENIIDDREYEAKMESKP